MGSFGAFFIAETMLCTHPAVAASFCHQFHLSCPILYRKLLPAVVSLSRNIHIRNDLIESSILVIVNISKLIAFNLKNLKVPVASSGSNHAVKKAEEIFERKGKRFVM
mmetsp:Transcript_27503/g.40269  ORF Transcript_27503/g.40269 Transcript_27503/m.40269 type:complete len:108 (-) Transcript_27503:735-1058(-)